MKILVAENDPPIREKIKKILKEAGYEVVITINTEEALNLIGETEFNLILLDIVFDGDGSRLYDQLRRTPGYKKIPVVILATPSQWETACEEEIFNKSMEHLYKPFDKSTLLKCVEKFVKVAPEPAATEEIDALLEEMKKFRKKPKQLLEPITVNITPDGMLAYGTINYVRGKKLPTHEEVIKLLREKGVKFGIEEENIKTALELKSFNKPIIFARGIYPQIFSIVPDFKFNTNPKLEELPIIVKANEILVIARKSTPTPGKEVSGKEISPPKGEELPVKAGIGTILDEEHKLIRAEITGDVYYDGDEINVFPIEEITKPIARDEEIEHNGTLWIKAPVHAGAKIFTKGNIIIDGIVDACTIESHANIIIRNIVQGRKLGKLIAKGKVFAKKLDSVEVQARDIEILESIEECIISAKNSIRTNKLIGGYTRFCELLIANTIGTELETPTEIEISIGESESIKKAHELIQKYEAKELSQEEQTKLLELKKLLSELQTASGRIIFETIYPGVKIKVLSKEVFIDKPYSHGKIIFKDNKVQVI